MSDVKEPLDRDASLADPRMTLDERKGPRCTFEPRGASGQRLRSIAIYPDLPRQPATNEPWWTVRPRLTPRRRTADASRRQSGKG